MYPGFEYRIRRLTLVEFVVGSHACSVAYEFSGFPPSTRTNTSKFQFYLETVDIERAFSFLQKKSFGNFRLGKERCICHQFHSKEPMVAWPLNRPRKVWNWQ